MNRSNLSSPVAVPAGQGWGGRGQALVRGDCQGGGANGERGLQLPLPGHGARAVQRRVRHLRRRLTERSTSTFSSIFRIRTTFV